MVGTFFLCNYPPPLHTDPLCEVAVIEWRLLEVSSCLLLECFGRQRVQPPDATVDLAPAEMHSTVWLTTPGIRLRPYTTGCCWQKGFGVFSGVASTWYTGIHVQPLDNVPNYRTPTKICGKVHISMVFQHNVHFPFKNGIKRMFWFEGHPLLYCHFKELICVFAPLFALDSSVMNIYSLFL